MNNESLDIHLAARNNKRNFSRTLAAVGFAAIAVGSAATSQNKSLPGKNLAAPAMVQPNGHVLITAATPLGNDDYGTSVEIPLSMEPCMYSIRVIANDNPSAPVTMQIKGGYVLPGS